MANIISALFNGGTLYKPKVAKWIGRHDDEKIFSFVPEITGRVGIKPEYMDLVKTGLMAAVNEPHGTGWRAKLKHVEVAGKTGTAQVITLEREKQLHKAGELPLHFRDHAWFVAIAPASRPRIALAVVIEHGGHGGSAAAPIAKDMIKAYLDISS
jgi:penicillin-binding protein 2